MNIPKALGMSFFNFIKTTPGQLALSALLAITPFGLFSFVLITLVIARLIPFTAGIITRLAIGFSLVSCASGCIAVIAWLVHIPLGSAAVLLALTGLVGVIVWWAHKRGFPDSTPIKTDRNELVAFGLSLAVLIFIALPIIKEPNGANLLRVISAGGDNSAHLTMVKVVDLNQGLAFGNDNRVNALAGAANYPEFWYFNIAFYKWLINSFVFGNAQSQGKLLGIFYGATLVWFGLIIFFIVRLSLRISELVTKRKDLLGVLAATAVCAAITAHWLLQLFTNGFQTQTASLVLLLAESYLLFDAFKLQPAHRYSLLLLAGLLAVGCCLTWTFLIPVSATAVALGVITTVVANKKLPSLATCIIFILLAGFIVFQPLLLFVFPVSFEGGVSMIQQRGLINPISMPILLVVFGICLAYAWMNKNNSSLRAILFIATISIVFSLGLMAYQLYTLGELRYFYHKSTYAFIVIGGALLAATVYHFIHLLFNDKGRGVLALLFCAISSLVIWQIKDPAWQGFTDGTVGGMSGPAAAIVLQQTGKDPLLSANTTFIGACNRGEDIRANLFTTALTKTMVYRSGSFDQGQHNETLIFEAIAVHLRESDEPITIVSSDQAISARLKTHLGKLAQSTNFTLIELDMTPETEPISQCPNRIRDIVRFPVQ